MILLYGRGLVVGVISGLSSILPFFSCPYMCVLGVLVGGGGGWGWGAVFLKIEEMECATKEAKTKVYTCS